MPDNDYLLGYFAHFVSPQRGYYGGILVTDTRGVPKEFRHTDAVKPTRTQTVLYGDSLEASLGTDAIAPALYDALTIKPHILLIEAPSRPLFGSFLLKYRPAALLAALADRDLAFNDMLSLEGDLLAAQEFDLKGSSSERIYAYIEDSTDQQGNKILSTAQRSMNLITPFSRVTMVLTEVSQIETGTPRR
ncbi:hypothetical protein LC607_35310 [Nostoc sp. CHAB 5824]|nr:hypothetical protein [Nostoc sp. CHAB 5824]